MTFACGPTPSEKPAQGAPQTAGNASPAASAGPAPLSPDSTTLKRQPGQPLFNLERVNRIVSGPNDVIEVPAGKDLAIEGWAVDQAARTNAGGVNVVIDGQHYPAYYGITRADVATQFKVPSYSRSGFSCSLPAAKLGKGTHSVTIHVISKDGSSYYEGWSVTLKVQ